MKKLLRLFVIPVITVMLGFTAAEVANAKSGDMKYGYHLGVVEINETENRCVHKSPGATIKQ